MIIQFIALSVQSWVQIACLKWRMYLDILYSNTSTSDGVNNLLKYNRLYEGYLIEKMFHEYRCAGHKVVSVLSI